MGRKIPGRGLFFGVPVCVPPISTGARAPVGLYAPLPDVRMADGAWAVLRICQPSRRSFCQRAERPAGPGAPETRRVAPSLVASDYSRSYGRGAPHHGAAPHPRPRAERTEYHGPTPQHTATPGDDPTRWGNRTAARSSIFHIPDPPKGAALSTWHRPLGDTKRKGPPPDDLRGSPRKGRLVGGHPDRWKAVRTGHLPPRCEAREGCASPVVMPTIARPVPRRPQGAQAAQGSQPRTTCTPIGCACSGSVGSFPADGQRLHGNRGTEPEPYRADSR